MIVGKSLGVKSEGSKSKTHSSFQRDASSLSLIRATKHPVHSKFLTVCLSETTFYFPKQPFFAIPQNFSVYSVHTRPVVILFILLSFFFFYVCRRIDTFGLPSIVKKHLDKKQHVKSKNFSNK